MVSSKEVAPAVNCSLHMLIPQSMLLRSGANKAVFSCLHHISASQNDFDCLRTVLLVLSCLHVPTEYLFQISEELLDLE